MTISLEQFERMWEKHCERTFCISASELPDILCIDDYWHEHMSAQQAKAALVEMEHEMRQELHFDV